MCDLPKDYDVIVIGTGLTESILAAALSRIGKFVLHLDRNQFYGGEFSSHTLTNLISWVDDVKNTKETAQSSSKIKLDTDENENVDKIECNQNLNNYYSDLHFEWTNLAMNKPIDRHSSFKNYLIKNTRKFNIDLSPNLFYSRGPFIELLISSDVSKYCEFRLINQILTRRDNKIEKVPTSRAEVFKSNKLSVIEKRLMMQFVQACMKDNNFGGLIDEKTGNEISFSEFIKNRNLPSSISHYLIYAVAMCSNETDTCLRGLQQVKRFINSVNRFGDSPFLFCLYGTGELSQCFCRLAAVFGAIYYLNLNLDQIYVNKETNLVESISAKNDAHQFKFNCKHLIIDSSYAPHSFFTDNSDQIARCILLTNKSISTENNELSVLFLPALDDSQSDIYLFELSHMSKCCPEGYFLVYLFCKKTKPTSKEQFADYISLLFDFDTTNNFEQEKLSSELSMNESAEENENISAKASNAEATKPEEEETNKLPKILFSFYYSHPDSTKRVENSNTDSELPDNLIIVGGSRAELDFDYHCAEAEKLFRKICPTEVFLPKPPELEDIILNGEEDGENKNAENGDSDGPEKKQKVDESK